MEILEFVIDGLAGAIAIILGFIIAIKQKNDWISSLGKKLIETDKKLYSIFMGLLAIILGIGIITMPILNHFVGNYLGYWVGIGVIFGSIILMVVNQSVFSHRYTKARLAYIDELKKKVKNENKQ